MTGGDDMSVTSTVKSEAPPAVGVPEIKPLLLSKVKPFGNGPDPIARLHV